MVKKPMLDEKTLFEYLVYAGGTIMAGYSWWVRQQFKAQNDLIAELARTNARQDAMLVEYKEQAAERSAEMQLMNANIMHLTKALEAHMAHEEKEDAELKEELKEIRSEINDLKINLAHIPKRKGD
jgi:seryl-tRNA synthetase